VRLQGGGEAVADAEARVRQSAGAGLGAAALPALDPERAQAVWAALGRSEAEAALVARLADRPSALAETLAAALELPGAAAAWPVLAHAGCGIVRAVVGAAAYGGRDAGEWAAALGRTRSRLAAGGGTVLC